MLKIANEKGVAHKVYSLFFILMNPVNIIVAS